MNQKLLECKDVEFMAKPNGHRGFEVWAFSDLQDDSQFLTCAENWQTAVEAAAFFASHGFCFHRSRGHYFTLEGAGNDERAGEMGSSAAREAGAYGRSEQAGMGQYPQAATQ